MNVGRSIDLARAQESLTTSRRTSFHHRNKNRISAGAGISPPIRLSWECESVPIGRYSTSTATEVALYEFGGLSITWEIAFDERVADLIQLSTLLYDRAPLGERSRALAESVVEALATSIDRPDVSNDVEDYIVFQVRPTEDGPAALLENHRQSLAQILRAESAELSEQEVEDALANPVSYGRDDLCIVDWLGAFLMGDDAEDERLVLELATVELLELRLLDSRLESQIGGAYQLLARPHKSLLGALTIQRRELEQVARMQADDALLHEGIDNALKLFGDDYLARLYRSAARRFHFEDWDVSIQRKLGVLRSVYESLADQAAHRRSEMLEWIIIVLIAVDILLYFTPLR